MGPGELGGWIGIVGGTVGSVVGIAGGAIGTWFSIRNTRGPRERSFVIKASLVCWVAVTAFVVGLMVLPSPQRFFFWIPYAILLPLGISLFNRKQAELRRGECCEGGSK
jgi:hypothetical protein